MAEQPDRAFVRLVLIRHGESACNASGVIQGDISDDGGLTEAGLVQAEQAAKQLSKDYCDVRFVVRSAISRVVATAEITAQLLGIQAFEDPRLNELNMGAWQGRTREYVTEHFAQEVEALRSGEDVPRGGGETIAALAARVRPALDDAIERCVNEFGGGTVAVFTHGGVIRATGTLLGLPSDTPPFPRTKIPNGSLTVFEYCRPGSMLLRSWAQCPWDEAN